MFCNFTVRICGGLCPRRSNVVSPVHHSCYEILQFLSIYYIQIYIFLILNLFFFLIIFYCILCKSKDRYFWTNSTLIIKLCQVYTQQKTFFYNFIQFTKWFLYKYFSNLSNENRTYHQSLSYMYLVIKCS